MGCLKAAHMLVSLQPKSSGMSWSLPYRPAQCSAQNWNPGYYKHTRHTQSLTFIGPIHLFIAAACSAHTVVEDCSTCGAQAWTQPGPTCTTPCTALLMCVCMPRQQRLLGLASSSSEPVPGPAAASAPDWMCACQATKPVGSRKGSFRLVLPALPAEQHRTERVGVCVPG